MFIWSMQLVPINASRIKKNLNESVNNSLRYGNPKFAQNYYQKVTCAHSYANDNSWPLLEGYHFFMPLLVSIQIYFDCVIAVRHFSMSISISSSCLSSKHRNSLGPLWFSHTLTPISTNRLTSAWLTTMINALRCTPTFPRHLNWVSTLQCWPSSRVTT